MGNAQTFISCAGGGGTNSDGRSSNVPQHEFLTPTQKARALSTWAHLCDTSTPTDRGMRVFLRIFEINPSAKTLFKFKDLPNEDLHRNSLFKGHATRFMKSVEFTMQNLDALDVIVNPTLISIGHKHVHINGFHPDYLETFHVALMDIWEEDLGKKFAKETREAWKQIFNLITRKVYEGFQEEYFRIYNKNCECQQQQQLQSNSSSAPLASNGIQTSEIPANNNSCVSPEGMNGDINEEIAERKLCSQI